MPNWHTTGGEEAHAQWRGVDHADAFLFELIHEVDELVVVQTIVTEVQDALHRARFSVVYHPFNVFELQVGDAHMPHYAQFAELHQCRQCLVHHFLESSRKSGLKFYVVNVDEVDMVDVETVHALIHTLLRPLG